MVTRYYRGFGLVNTVSDWWTIHAQDTEATGKHRGKGYVGSVQGSVVDAKRWLGAWLDANQ